MSPSDAAITSALSDARAWPFEEARRLIARLDKLKGGAEIGRASCRERVYDDV